jgi:hypothetical protein
MRSRGEKPSNVGRIPGPRSTTAAGRVGPGRAGGGGGGGARGRRPCGARRGSAQHTHRAFCALASASRVTALARSQRPYRDHLTALSPSSSPMRVAPDPPVPFSGCVGSLTPSTKLRSGRSADLRGLRWSSIERLAPRAGYLLSVHLLNTLPVSPTSVGYCACDIVHSGYEMRASDGLGYTGSEVGNLRCRHRESGSRWLAYVLTR